MCVALGCCATVTDAPEQPTVLDAPEKPTVTDAPEKPTVTHEPIRAPKLPDLLRSTDGAETAITFKNCTKRELAYYWIDREGAQRYYGNVPAGAEVTQHTYNGHLWLLRDGSNLVALFRAEDAGVAFLGAC